MSYLQSPGTQGQKSGMNTVVFVNATIGFSETLFLVIIIIIRCTLANVSAYASQ